MSRTRLVALLLVLGTLAVYLQVARYGFSTFDDGDYVNANGMVYHGLTWVGIKWAFTSWYASNWHPLTWMSHMIDCQLFGLNPGPQHVINVLFHVLNALLVFVLLRRWLADDWIPAIVAALFAWHPMHVESVAWISERKDVLSTFFALLALLSYTRYARQGSTVHSPQSAVRRDRATVDRGPWTRDYSFALLFFVCALLSKPMYVTLPCVLLLLDYWPLDRRSKMGDGRWILEKLPFFALSAASCVITFLVQRKGGAVSTSISFGARVANAIVSHVHYILDMFWPTRLSVLYPHPGTWPTWEIVASAALLLLITVGVLFSARKHPYLSVGWFWYLGILVPAIGFVQVGIQCRADRYTYLPLIGLFIMVVWGSSDLLLYFKSAQAGSLSPSDGARGSVIPARPLNSGPSIAFISSLCLFALAACALITSRQIGYWRNSETLFRRAVQVTDKNYLAYNNLGYYLSNRGEIAEAMENYRKALEIKPDYEDAHNNLGYAYANQKKYPEASAEYEIALRIRPNHPEVHNNLGNALADIGRVDEAIAHYNITLKQKPEHADAHNNLGVALSMKGRYAEAIEHFHAALRYKPSDASAHSNLGNAYAIQGKFDLAIPEYQRAIAMNPKDSQAHNNLANCLSSQGKLDEAISEYNEALKMKPNDPEVHFNLAMALARQGNRQEAIKQYSEALRLKPDYVEAQNQLRALTTEPHNPP